MPPGRNDPCPCGSGRKYKQCCGKPRVDTLELAASVVRGVQDAVEPRVVRFTRDAFGEEALDLAWKAFSLNRRDIDRDGPESQLFLPWFLYDWLPLSRDPGGSAAIASRTPADAFLAERGSRLAVVDRRFLEAVARTPMSFHDVLHCEPGRSIRLRDVLLETEHTVFEKSGSDTIGAGDILYARVVPFESGVSLMIGSGSLVIPPIEKGVVLELRASLRKSFENLSDSLLRRIEPQLRELYFIIRARLLNPRMPEIRNTDNEPLEFHTLTYRIPSAEAAFAALQPLAVDHTAEELLKDAERDKHGGLLRVRIPWIRPGNKMSAALPTTSLGEIVIDGTTLTATVNSKKRASTFRAELKKRMGDDAELVSDEGQSLKKALRENERRRDTKEDIEARRRNEDLQARPEVQKAIAAMHAAHWADWPNERLPALRGKTPRQAVKDRDGREMVEALLLQFERYQERAPAAAPPYDFNVLRDSLGLKRRSPHRSAPETSV